MAGGDFRDSESVLLLYTQVWSVASYLYMIEAKGRTREKERHDWRGRGGKIDGEGEGDCFISQLILFWGGFCDAKVQVNR